MIYSKDDAKRMLDDVLTRYSKGNSFGRAIELFGPYQHLKKVIAEMKKELDTPPVIPCAKPAHDPFCMNCGHPHSWHDTVRCWGDPRYKGVCNVRCERFVGTK